MSVIPGLSPAPRRYEYHLTGQEAMAMERLRAQQRHVRASRELLLDHVCANLSPRYPQGLDRLLAYLNAGHLGIYQHGELLALLIELRSLGRAAKIPGKGWLRK